MAEAGADPAYTMRQIGHRRSSFTLEVYTDVKAPREAANARLGALLSGTEKAQKGATGLIASADAPEANEAEAAFPA
jgi:hypothetical protein